MYLNTTTLQQCTERDIRALFPGVSHPDPFRPPEGYEVLFAAPQPAYDPITQFVRETTPVLTSKGHWEQRWQVVGLDTETVASNQAAKAAADEATVAAKTDALWKAADAYVSSYISGVAIGLLTIGVLQQKPKALAVTAWSSSVWAEYYARKALVTAVSQDDLDFSFAGPMPFSVPELQQEIGL